MTDALSTIEFHVHTKAGSADSSITADQLAEYASRDGLGAIVVAEHFRVWADWERESFFERTGTRVYRAMEATTDLGHILVIGAPAGYSPPHSAMDLLTTIRHEGWFSVLAHPFRHYFDNIHPSYRPHFESGQSVETLSEHSIFELVDAIEVENGASTDRENAMAWDVARQLGLPMTSGSDAHSESELGRCRMQVDAIPVDEEELARLITSWSTERLPLEAS